MRILGIDPSLTATGLAIVADGRIEDLRVVETKKLTGHERLAKLVREVTDAAASVDAVAIEGPSMGSKGSAVVQIFGLWTLLAHSLWQMGREPYIVAPAARALYGAGKGNADKDTVLLHVDRRYRDDRVNNNNIADALIIAAVLARLLGEPIEDNMPQANLRALAGVQVPTQALGA